MKNRLLLAVLSLCFLWGCGQDHDSSFSSFDAKHQPSEDFFLKRSYPDDHFNLKGYEKALSKARAALQLRSGAFPGFDQPWTVRGPGNLGARINTIAVHPQDDATIYIGFSRGGVWKTTDDGASWAPIFDDQPFLAIGDIEIDPTDPERVYVATGDPNISSHPGIGDGLYRSDDGGQTWEKLGLQAQRILPRILVHPDQPDILTVAAMGLPFERNTQRGIYQSTDGGASWVQTLFISDQAGAIDLVRHPANPEVLYASGWDRIRSNTESLVTGPGAKVFRSMDGGLTWEMLSGGLPMEPTGRVGLAVTPAAPENVYAMYVGPNSQLQGIYKSEDEGESWSLITENLGMNGLPTDALGGFGWYFGKLRVSQVSEDDIFLLGVDLWRSPDGGANWAMASPPWFIYEVHADKHDLVFDSQENILLATDGGLYRSDYSAFIWEDMERIPTSQYYRIAWNPHRPNWVYGGAQDNGTSGGPNLEFEWPRIYGGDGFQTAFRPDLPQVIYAETQRGNIVGSSDEGQSWFSATEGIIPTDRRDWDMPYIISPHDPDVMYTGTFRVYQSTAGIVPQWAPISEDLTDGLVLHPRYHAITSIQESALVEGRLYVGTVDANVWRSDNAGGQWTNISAGLPERYVTSVKPSPDFEDYVYAAHSGYKDNDFIPHLHRSKDAGQTWEDISGDLPPLAVNDVYILPGHQDSILFAGTDGGVYGTMNAGMQWERLGSDLPFVPVYDLEYDSINNRLLVGTFARSILSYPLDSLIVEQEMEDTTVVQVNELELQSAVEAHPNPATAFVDLSFSNIYPGRAYEIAILNANGQLVELTKGQQQGRAVHQIDIQNWPAGWYVAKVKMHHQIHQVKFLKQ